MRLTEVIDKIIGERKLKSQRFIEKTNRYAKIKETVEQIIKLKNSIPFDNPQAQKMMGPHFIELLSKLDATEFNKRYSELRARLNDLSGRYSNDEINIAVVGKARQGKSMLLQSISGLNNNVIPAFEGAHCTGTTSVIRNNGAIDGVLAQIYFKTPIEIATEINDYLSKICDASPELKPDYPIYMVDGNDMDRCMEKLSAAIRKWEEAGYINDKNSQYFIKFQKFVEHYEEWKELVETYGSSGKCLELRDEAEIVKYVAQYSYKEDKTAEYYYNYLAVRSAEISCRFVYPDAGKIVLRDTIGIGDVDSLNLYESMVSTISDNCDAAIILSRPESVGTIYDETTTNMYNQLSGACSRRKMAMDQWFFWVLNHTKPGSAPGDNTNGCSILRDEIDKHRCKYADIYMADASDQNEVTNNIIIPMLTKLTENLPKLDRAQEIVIEEAAARVREEYEKIYRIIKEADECYHPQRLETRGLNGVGSKVFSKLRDSIEQIMSEFVTNGVDAVEDEGFTVCEILRKAMSSISPQDLGKGSGATYFPTVEEVNDFLNSPYEHMTAEFIVKTVLNKVRIDFTKRFIDMDEDLNNLVLDVKRQVCENLISICKFDSLVNAVRQDDNSYVDYNKYYNMKIVHTDEFNATVTPINPEKEIDYNNWLKAVARCLRSVCLKCGMTDKVYNDACVALEFLSDYSISVRSFMMASVRSSLSLLDPSNPSCNRFMEQLRSNSTTKQERALMFVNGLKRDYRRTFEKVEEKVRTLYKEPSKLIHSCLTEFIDRMIKSSVIAYNDNEERYTIEAADTSFWNRLYADAADQFMDAEAKELSEKLAALKPELSLFANNHISDI